MAEAENPAQAAETQTPPAQAAGGDDRLSILEKELKEARAEAAKYRTEKRSQEEARIAAEQAALAEQGKFKELFEKEQAARAALEAQVAQAQLRQLQLDAATAAGLPASMAARLMGSTAEELALDAKALAETMKVPPPALGASNPAAQRGQPPAAQFDPKNPPRLSSIPWKK